ncbi:MAG: V-type ATPase subunit [Clostridia bacterium]|nr:V-type ATPase subunit [Clostridia bacterium]
MSGSSFVFSNARVKAKEKNLLAISQLNRLIDCQALDDAFKMLVEFGYGSGSSYENKDFDRLFAIEENNATALLRELDVKDSGLSVFLTKNDFHNAKALYKARELELLSSKDDSFNSTLASQGYITVEKLRDALLAKDYRNLSIEMSATLKKLDNLKDAGKLSPHIIDVEVDKAMFAEILAVLKKAKRKELSNYFVQTIDIANISAFVRSKRLDLPLSFFENGFIEGGNLNFKFYESMFEQSLELFKEKMKYTQYASLGEVATDKSGLSKFEVECDNMLLSIFKKEKNNMFTASPIAGFYLGKLTELKVVKLVVAALKNGVDAQVMKQRMRELYA